MLSLTHPLEALADEEARPTVRWGFDILVDVIVWKVEPDDDDDDDDDDGALVDGIDNDGDGN